MKRFLLQIGVTLTGLLFTTLWLSAQPERSAQEVVEQIVQIRPEAVLLVPPAGPAREASGNEKMVAEFFAGHTPGRLFIVSREEGVWEIRHLDGQWNIVRPDGSRVAIDQKVFAREFEEQVKRGRIQGELTACMSNLKNIGTALEMYSTDYSGRYPTSDMGLNVLAPDYLRYIPECPAAGKVTYSYDCGPDAPLNGPGYQDYYEVRCLGGNHKDAGLEGDLPMYTGIVGLIWTDEELVKVLEQTKLERQQR